MKKKKEGVRGGKKARRILTAILIDPMGWSGATAEQEFEEISETFSEALAPHKLDIYRALSPQFKVGTELVIFDFGGMLPGTDLPERNAREVIKWAEENPSGLLVIRSTFTYDHTILPLLEELGLAERKVPYADDPFGRPTPTFPNIILNLFGENLPEWFTGKKAV